MVSAVKKQIDVTRLLAELSAASVELLSAQCAADRVRLQYSPQDIATFGEPRTLKRAIASAEALHQFFSQIEAQTKKQEADTMTAPARSPFALIPFGIVTSVVLLRGPVEERYFSTRMKSPDDPLTATVSLEASRLPK